MSDDHSSALDIAYRRAVRFHEQAGDTPAT